MDSRRIVLVSETDFVKSSELNKVSSAIQKQINDHFTPNWGIQAAIDPLDRLTDIPPNSWPVVIRDNIGINVAGVHWNETADKPFSLVTFREGDRPEDGWQATVSHEVLEMLADPFGKEFRTAPSLVPGGDPVEYLVEICDPCQAKIYWIDDVPVSDFVLPDYYSAFVSGIYSFAKNITEPRQVLPGGYVTWRELIGPTPQWSQYVITSAGPEFRDLGTNPPPDVHLRGFIDRQTDDYMAQVAARKVRKKRGPRLARLTAPGISGHSAVRQAEGERWQRRIERLLHSANVAQSSPSPPSKRSK